MEDIKSLTSEDILADETFVNIFEQEDPISRTRLKLKLFDRAKELGVKAKFEELLKAYEKADREMKKEEKEKRSVCLVDNYTNFEGPYDTMFCGAWIASENGIFAQTSGGLDEVACYHPILPVERLKNLETGEEQLKIAYKRNHHWEEIIVPKVMVTSANKIVGLSARGIAVTSENSKLLVKYLADVENSNDDYIGIQYSSSKLGWIGDGFIPYDSEIVFDGDSRFKQIFESVKKQGDEDTWLNHLRELRKSNRMEIKFMLAASFSSVLVKRLDALPYIVDLWGETEGGKSVSLMVAASVWANPAESQYIGDLKTTDVALEAKSDMLNNLPLMLDDTSKTSARIRDNFEGIVYDLCSGKGKSRSNKDLGINRENRWQNCILTNGERPLNSYVGQGGAINRILEVECGEKVYQDPQRTAGIVKKNIGFGGKMFIDALCEIGVDKIKEIQQDFQKQLFDDKNMQKQSISLSIVLTADKIATDYIFKDGQYIDIEDAKKVLIDRNELSDNERCYRYLQDKIAMNAQRFDWETKCEKWGIIEDGWAIIYNSAFEALCKEEGYSKKSFLSWADRQGIIQSQGGNATRVKKVNGKSNRCVFLLLDDTQVVANDGFIDAPDELPFD